MVYCVSTVRVFFCGLADTLWIALTAEDMAFICHASHSREAI